MSDALLLKRSFYDREPVTVATRLLGKNLVRQKDEEKTVGMIVETEAYRGSDDPASHAYRGRTARNRAMFQGPGLAYIYFIYGTHHCFNVTTRKVGAVLVRSLEPLEGIETMMRRRGTENLLNLTNGPGKLSKAMAIDDSLYGLDLTRDQRLFLTRPEEESSFRIARSWRVGIKKARERKWRFYIKNNKFVSKT